MTARMPGTCRGCGARVELRIGERVRSTSNGYGTFEGAPIAPHWVYPNSDMPHLCLNRTGVRSTMSGSGVAQTTRTLANPDETGVDMRHNGTPVKNVAKRARR